MTTMTSIEASDLELAEPSQHNPETRADASCEAAPSDPEFKITVRKVAVKVQVRGVLAE
jgi:hypothetical protein